MKPAWLGLLLCVLPWGASPLLAAEPDPPNLPPGREVARLLADAPAVQAALARKKAEEANRLRLEAGPHEWNFRAGSLQRRVRSGTLPGETYRELALGLERPLRLPGKASLDADIGHAGVALAERDLGDSRHELSRLLLKSWFDWLREVESHTQWRQQNTLLEKQANAVKRRQQLGDAARIETIQAEAALAQASAQLAQAKAREQAKAETLRRLFPGLDLPPPKPLLKPQALNGEAEFWITAVLEHNHELALAEGEQQRTGLLAERTRLERLPDPSIGLAWSRERGGEENVLGAYISIPLPGQARFAAADASEAQHLNARLLADALRQKITAEAAALFHSAKEAVPAWESAQLAASRLDESARLSERAYQLGEGTLNELLASRRLANEAALAARTQQLDALELNYRLLLDTHQLWVFD